MGRHYGLTAIKNSPPEEILGVTDKFYKEKNIELKEIGYGQTSSPYLDGKVYKDIEEMKDDGDLPLYKKRGKKSKTITFYQNLEKNKDWTFFVYDLTKERKSLYDREIGLKALRPDSSFSSFLSKDLKTIVVDYLIEDYDGSLILRLYENGKITDSLEVNNLDVTVAKGKFKDLKSDFDDLDALLEKNLIPYLDELSFYPEAEEVLDYTEPGKWRLFYLDGEENTLLSYSNSL